MMIAHDLPELTFTEPSIQLVKFYRSPSYATEWPINKPAFVKADTNVFIGGTFEDIQFVKKYDHFYQIIHSFASLPSNWDSYGAKPPSQTAINRAVEYLSTLAQYKLVPNAVGPSPDGGVMLEFSIGSKYFLLDFYNDGDLVFLRENEHGITQTTQEDVSEGMVPIILEMQQARRQP